MPEPPKPKFTAQHRLALLLGGAALMVLGGLGALTYVDFVAVTIVEGPGYDPRLIMLGFSVALFLMGLGAVISALRMKTR
jgi:hypothetical protein